MKFSLRLTFDQLRGNNSERVELLFVKVDRLHDFGEQALEVLFVHGDAMLE